MLKRFLNSYAFFSGLMFSLAFFSTLLVEPELFTFFMFLLIGFAFYRVYRLVSLSTSSPPTLINQRRPIELLHARGDSAGESV